MDDDALTELARSIATEGLLQPILLGRRGDRYEIIAGHRRFRAVQSLGWPAIPALLVAREDTAARVTMLIENVQREDLNPTDEADMVQDLATASGLPPAQLAIRLGKSHDWITKRLALHHADQAIREAVRDGWLRLGAALELLRITDLDWRAYYRHHAILEGATVEKVRGWAQQANQQIELQQAQGLPTVAPSALEPPPEPLYPCWCCSVPRPISDLRAQQVCYTCLKQIADLQEATD